MGSWDNVRFSLTPFDATSDRRRERRALTEDDCLWILAIAGKYEPVVHFALGTGLRCRECRELQWQDVRLDGADGRHPHLALRAEATKATCADVVPLTPDLAARPRAARPAPFDPRGRVFVFNAVPRPEQWIAILGRAEVDYIHPQNGKQAGSHSLRVTLSTKLKRAGVDADTRRQILRNRDDRITWETYTDKECPGFSTAVRDSRTMPTPSGATAVATMYRTVRCLPEYAIGSAHRYRWVHLRTTQQL